METIDLVSAREAARILGVAPSTITRQVTAGRLFPLGRLSTRGAYVFRRQAITEAAEAEQ